MQLVSVKITTPETIGVVIQPVSTGPPGVGANWRGVWSGATTYALGDGVQGSDGHNYISLVGSNLNHNPTSTSGFWSDLLPGSVVNVGASAPGSGVTSDVFLVRSDGTVARFTAPEVLVDAWGADPTGVADSTTAIGNAIATGYTVVFGSGTYKDSGSGHTVDPHSQEIRGAGKNNTLISYTGTGTWLSSTTPGFAVRAMSIRGSASGVAGLSLGSGAAGGMLDWTLEDVDVYGFSTGTAIKLTNVNTGNWRNTNARTSNIGLDCDIYCNLNTFTGGNISGNVTGVRVGHTIVAGNQPTSNYFKGIQFGGNTGVPFLLQYGDGNVLSNLWFEGNTAGTNPDIQIGTASLVASANRVIGCDFADSNAITNNVQVVNGANNEIGPNLHGGTSTNNVRLEANASYTRVFNTSKISDLGTHSILVGIGSNNSGAFGVYLTAATSLATGAIVPFDTGVAPGFNSDAAVDLITNKGRFTPKVLGIYRLSTNVSANAAITSGQYFQLQLKKNGSILHWGPANFQGGTGTAVTGFGSWLVSAANGDYFEVALSHNTGGSVALAVGSTLTYFHGERVATT